MKNNLILLLLLTPLFALSQQVDRLYTVGGALYQTSSLDGIGINEDRPDAALHINQSDDKGTALQQGTALQIDLEFSTTTRPAYAFKINGFNNEVIPFQLSPLLSVDASGRTRIGYFNSGNEKLMVTNSIGIYKTSAANMVRLGYDVNYIYPQIVWKTSSNQNFQFKNGSTGAVPITLSPDGKVGINTDNFLGDHSLYIEGSSIAEEMFVKLKGDWPDFVFHPDYTLMPLTDLERFIDQNGHLPEMPNAEEVKEEGVKTGETIRLLTQKVEELTLYLLQQQKEIEALKEKLEKRKKDERK